MKVKSNEIDTTKEFCSQIMLIWRNAQSYNPPENKVYIISRKCHQETKRLIRKYFPELCAQSNSPYDEELAIIKYAQKVDENGNSQKVRRSLHCSVCKEQMDFMIGFHENCVLANPDGEIHCSSCRIILRGTTVGYYHCVEGCIDGVESKSNDKSHDPPIYLCENCAASKYDSRRYVYQRRCCSNLPFYGLWIDIDNDWYEAIIVTQDANRIYYKLAFSSIQEQEVDAQKGEWMSAATIIHCDSQTGIITFNLDVDPGEDIADFSHTQED